MFTGIVEEKAKVVAIATEEVTNISPYNAVSLASLKLTRAWLTMEFALRLQK